MSIRPELRAIVMRAIEKIGQQVVTPLGYDKAAWRARVMDHMATDEPEARAEVAADCETVWYGQRIDEYIRHSRDAAVETVRDIDALKRALKAENRIVQIRAEDGSFVAKRLTDCTATEHDQIADQYEKSSASDARRARFHRLLARQMRLAGLAETDTLAKLLAA